MPCLTESISSGQRLATSGSRTPTRKTRRRRWGTPKYRASSTAHSVTSDPASTTASRTRLKSFPSLVDNAEGTFSQTMNLGYRPFVASLSSLIMRMPSKNSEDFSPSKPFLLPAIDKSWHGLPQTTTSICRHAARTAAPVRVWMSPCLGTNGQCLFKIVKQSGSDSHWNTVCNPALSRPRSNPPTPLKRDSTFTCPVRTRELRTQSPRR